MLDKKPHDNITVPYGRGARAISREVERSGVECTTERAQQIIDAYLNKFKRIAMFLQWCREQVYSPGYLESVYGRRRWFFNVQDKAAMKAQEREATNFLIQNLVAEALTASIPIFCDYRRKHNLKFRLKLAIHDAMMIACRGEDVPRMVEEVIPYCMSKGNVVPKLNFSFGIDLSAYLRWYEKPTQELLEANGWPKGYKIPK